MTGRDGANSQDDRLSRGFSPDDGNHPANIFHKDSIAKNLYSREDNWELNSKIYGWVNEKTEEKAIKTHKQLTKNTIKNREIDRYNKLLRIIDFP